MLKRNVLSEISKLRTEFNQEIHKVRTEIGVNDDKLRKEIKDVVLSIANDISDIEKVIGNKKSSNNSIGIIQGLLGLKEKNIPTLLERLNKLEEFLGVEYSVEKIIKKGYTKVKNKK